MQNNSKIKNKIETDVNDLLNDKNLFNDEKCFQLRELLNNTDSDNEKKIILDIVFNDNDKENKTSTNITNSNTKLTVFQQIFIEDLHDDVFLSKNNTIQNYINKK